MNEAVATRYESCFTEAELCACYKCNQSDNQALLSEIVSEACSEVNAYNSILANREMA